MEKKLPKGRHIVSKKSFDFNSGLPIIINLYVIKYIYYHIDKAEQFIERSGGGKKTKAHLIYQRELPMSRQRFCRIMNGSNFQITKEEAKNIVERYGIEKRYFRRDNPVAFEIDGISNIEEWKCFFCENNGIPYEFEHYFTEETIKKKAAKVETVLQELFYEDWEIRFDKHSPLFAICHYFHYGRRANEPSGVTKAKELLEKLNFSDWDKEPVEMLEVAEELLEKHYNYVHSLLTIIGLRK